MRAVSKTEKQGQRTKVWYGSGGKTQKHDTLPRTKTHGCLNIQTN